MSAISWLAAAAAAAAGASPQGPAAAPGAAQEAELEETQAPLSCKVVDSSGQPVEGATVEVVYVLTRLIESYYDSSSYHKLSSLVHQPVERIVASGKTDGNGEFSAVLPRGRAFDVRTRAEGLVAKVESDRYAGERIDVVLYRPATIEGHVRRVKDSSPVESGTVHIVVIDWNRRPASEVRLTAGGIYRAEGLLPDRYAVRVEPELESVEEDYVDMAEGESKSVDLDVKLGERAQGTVLDGSTQRPIADALVSIYQAKSKYTRTDANGRFSISGVPHDGSYVDLSAFAEGYAGCLHQRPISLESIFRVDLLLAPARTIRGKLVDPDGKPVERAYVAAVYTLFHVDAGTFELRETESREDGSFELTDLLADEHHTLCAWKEDLAPLFFDMPQEERSKNDWDVGVLRFPRPASLGGTVVSADGSVLAGVRIRLSGVCKPELDRRNDCFRDARALPTDERGRFLATDLAPGHYTLRFGARRMSNDFSTEVEVAEAEDKRLGRITMPANFFDERR